LRTVAKSDCLQDIIFGSEGTAQADFERMEEINAEIGLTAILRDGNFGGHGSASEMEKKPQEQHTEVV
jgi:hypothetical protein